jgi:hypothetical protein
MYRHACIGNLDRDRCPNTSFLCEGGFAYVVGPDASALWRLERTQWSHLFRCIHLELLFVALHMDYAVK